MTVDGYVSLISSGTAQPCEFTLAYSCRDAYYQILALENFGTEPDIAFIDLNLPPFEEQQILSGTDVALLVRQKFPRCKVVIISMHKEPVWVDSIFKTVAPEGFLSKNDINYDSFPEICEIILAGEHFISQSIRESQALFIRKNINWDAYDSKILLLLSEGVKTINLPEYVGLSLSTIEKRKANIKRQILFTDGSDQELIRTAKQFGLL